jgi:integrase
MPASQRAGKQSKKSTSFRVGRVRAYLRGRVWYLCYQEHGQRHQPRVGPDREATRQMASEVNAQLEVGAPSALGFEPISVPAVRQRWLDHHEHIRRSSLHTIRRYNSATQHLLNFIQDVRPLRRVSDFHAVQAEEFVRYLRSLSVAPNGHVNARKRCLRDNGIKYVLETCSTLFNYAARHRHLPPYVENPFLTIEIHRIPVEDPKPIVVFSSDMERRFLTACDEWQFPIFATLMLTGMRPGELVHLLLSEDLDLNAGWLYVRNKPRLGWKVKTRNERAIPLVPALQAVLQQQIGSRDTGPVFLQRRCFSGHQPPLIHYQRQQLERELVCRSERNGATDRSGLAVTAKTVWRDLGALKYDWLRKEFMKVTDKCGMSETTAPKTLRHTFATCLQDANVDPLIRNELMGHAPASFGANGCGLGMTAVYTHTRPETKRRQLEAAMQDRPVVTLANIFVAGARQIQQTATKSASVSS